MPNKDQDPGLNRNLDNEPQLPRFPIVVKNPNRIANTINKIEPVYEGFDTSNKNSDINLFREPRIQLPNGEKLSMKMEIDFRSYKDKTDLKDRKNLITHIFAEASEQKPRDYTVDFMQLIAFQSLLNNTHRLKSDLAEFDQTKAYTGSHIKTDEADLDYNSLSSTEAQTKFANDLLEHFSNYIANPYYFEIEPFQELLRSTGLDEAKAKQLIALAAKQLLILRQPLTRIKFNSEVQTFFRQQFNHDDWYGSFFSHIHLFKTDTPPIQLFLPDDSFEVLKGSKVGPLQDQRGRLPSIFPTMYFPNQGDLTVCKASDIINYYETVSDTLTAYFHLKGWAIPTEPTVIELKNDRGGDIPDDASDQIVVTSTSSTAEKRTLIGEQPGSSSSSTDSRKGVDNSSSAKPSLDAQHTTREGQPQNPGDGFELVGGQEKAVEKAKILVNIINNTEVFSKRGVRPPKGMLFLGPPGTGKTLLAKVIAQESHAEFMHIKITDILSKWFGESSENLLEYFESARAMTAKGKKVIIFMDELEALGKKRGESDDPINRVVSTLLVELDGLEKNSNIILLAATNRRDMIDPAILRSGRIDEEVTFEIPSAEALVKIFEIHLRNINSQAESMSGQFDPNINWQIIAGFAAEARFVGADVENLLQQVLRSKINEEIIKGISFTPVTVGELIYAIGQFKPTSQS